jgi:hypothetical protein
MSVTTTDSLKSAIDYLGAVEVAPGRYAFYSQGTKRWYTTTAASVRVIGAGEQFETAPDPIVGMPQWWTPERRYRFTCGQGHAFKTETKPAFEYGCAVCGSLMRGVTADLETGQEANV